MSGCRKVLLGSLILLFIGIQLSVAAEAIKHRLILCEYPQRIIEVSAEGKLTWEHQTPSVMVMCEVFTNGDILYACGGSPSGAQRVNRDHKVLWNYVSSCPQVMALSALPNGNVLLGEQGPCRAVEVTASGQVAHTVDLITSEKEFHRQLRHLHQLADGHILACHEMEGAVREYTSDGKMVWEYLGVPSVFEALRLKNGNTLIACGTQKRVIEVSPEKKIVWQFGAEDAPELNLTWITSLQQLKNGNFVIGNFLRGQEGKGAHAFEVTREKKVVWTFADHHLAKTVTEVRVLE
ncbi:MAG: hypothetical protein JWM68_67 [Verrucomicrobiales bacterium]|nr:hypothetical protein [Verrucomicrobiales bacterium]